MHGPSPTDVDNITSQWDDGEMQDVDRSMTIHWSELLDRIAEPGTRWLTAVAADGRPHTRPLFAPVVDGRVWVASSDRAAKTTLLSAGVAASLAIPTADLDVVWTGAAREEDDPRVIERVAAGFRATYGWDVEADGDALIAPYGAPTAGPPPYRAFALDPHVVHAVGTAAPFTGRSTRWSFDRGAAS